MNHKRYQSGFTIVELLIVIVVIGILAAITIVAYNGVQARARVAQKETDIRTLQVKLEAYRSTNDNEYYPRIDDPTSSATAIASLDLGASLQPRIVPSDEGTLNCDNPQMTKQDYCLGSYDNTYKIWWWHDSDKIWKTVERTINGDEWRGENGSGDQPGYIPN